MRVIALMEYAELQTAPANYPTLEDINGHSELTRSKEICILGYAKYDMLKCIIFNIGIGGGPGTGITVLTQMAMPFPTVTKMLTLKSHHLYSKRVMCCSSIMIQ